MPRSVFVTGGDRGIGAAAEGFVAGGGRVAVVHRGGQPPQGLGEVLVANAGITCDRLLLRMVEEGLTSVLDVNLTGTYQAAKRAANGMLRVRAGRITLVASAVATGTALPVGGGMVMGH
ncbi:SDR family NAD(P)-dependent oxidoreductase [Streptomyces sp. NPDC054796]